MPTITVRISDEQKKLLLKSGDLSKSVREALELYFDSRKSREVLKRLGALQRENTVRTTPEEEVGLISQDRRR